MTISDCACLLAGAFFGAVLWSAADDPIVGPLAFFIMLALGVTLAVGTHVPGGER